MPLGSRGRKRMNCCLKERLNFALFDAQQVGAHAPQITEEKTQNKAGAGKCLDLHHRPEARLEHRAGTHVYTGSVSRTRTNATRNDSILPGVEFSLSS